jgi:hypothetical protein
MKNNTGRILWIAICMLTLSGHLIAQISFMQNTTSGLPAAYDADVADLENDGDLDVVTVTFATTHSVVNIYTNDGSGNFTVLSGTAFSSLKFLPIDVKFIDIDGDNDQDLLIVSTSAYYANTLDTRLYRNDGGNTFTHMTGFPALNMNGTAAVGDIDNDNDNDIIIVGQNQNGTSDTYSPFVNDGSGNFTYSTNPTAPNFANHALQVPIITEISGSSPADLVIGNFNNASGLSFVGTFDGVYVGNGSATGRISNNNVTVADIDGDGDNDIIANASVNTLTYINDGSGNFTQSSTVLSASKSGVLFTGDIDNDGDIDIYSATNTTGGIYINEGSGNFTLDNSFTPPNILNGEGFFVDLNGDNLLDMLLFDYGSDATYYYVNNSTTTRAIDLDGTNIYTGNHQAALNTLPMTIEFKVHAADNYSPGVLDKWSGTNGFEILLVAGHLRINYQSDASNNVFLNSGEKVGIYSWHHVAVVFESSGMKVYVDGLLKNTAAWTGTPTAISNTANLRIGRAISSGPTFYSDNLDEVRIWNTARSQAEIVANMCNTISEPWKNANLVAYYNMNGTINGSTNVFDRSSNYNHLTLSGGSRVNTAEQTGCTAPNLPVELIDFTGRLENRQVFLDWSTASEENNSGFEIQRAVGSGQFAENLSWETVGFIQGNGTTIEVSDYEFVDNQPSEGENYYRLKQLDYDGKFEYSNIVNLTIQQSSNQVIKLFPNPASNNITIETNTPALVQITNINGQLIQEQSINSTTTISVKDLPNGIYCIKMGTNTQKLIIQK